jgi:hypothetical protein
MCPIINGSGSGNGGSSSAISDVLFYAGPTNFTLDSGNGWGYNVAPADLGTPRYSRGSDITVHAANDGTAEFETAAGGDFRVGYYFDAKLNVEDGGSTDLRLVSAASGNNSSSNGNDSTLPLVLLQQVYDTRDSPYFGVAAGGRFAGGMGVFLINGTGTDSVFVNFYPYVYKLGPLPT